MEETFLLSDTNGSLRPKCGAGLSVHGHVGGRLNSEKVALLWLLALVQVLNENGVSENHTA